MVIFYCYVSLPEGKRYNLSQWRLWTNQVEPLPLGFRELSSSTKCWSVMRVDKSCQIQSSQKLWVRSNWFTNCVFADRRTLGECSLAAQTEHRRCGEPSGLLVGVRLAMSGHQQPSESWTFQCPSTLGSAFLIILSMPSWTFWPLWFQATVATVQWDGSFVHSTGGQSPQGAGICPAIHWSHHHWGVIGTGPTPGPTRSASWNHWGVRTTIFWGEPRSIYNALEPGTVR